MKKLKYILPLLTAALFLFSGIKTDAATAQKELEAGTKKASLTMTLKNLQSVEGKISVKAKTSGAKITLKKVSLKSDKNKSAICEASGDKIYMVSKGNETTVTVTVDVEFSGDGAYTVALKGGCTDKDGKYKADGVSETIKVTVGSSESEETEEDEEEETKETIEEDKNKTETKKNETTSASKKTEPIEKETKTTREPVEVLEEEERVIEEFLEEVKSELEEKDKEAPKEVQEKSSKSMGDFIKYLRSFWFVFVILFLILAIAAHKLWRLFRKGRKNDYDGAPMVDYNIEDDD